MPRSQNKVTSHRRRKRVLKSAKGYWGARNKVSTQLQSIALKRIAICLS